MADTAMADAAMADAAMADAAMADAALVSPAMDLTGGLDQADVSFFAQQNGVFAHPHMQRVLQFFPVVLMLAMQIYFAVKGPTKGKKKTLEEAADPADPKVFFDITIGGKPAGRVESELPAPALDCTLCTALHTVDRAARAAPHALHSRAPHAPHCTLCITHSRTTGCSPTLCPPLATLCSVALRQGVPEDV